MKSQTLYTLPGLHSGGFCKPTMKYPDIFDWFSGEVRLLFEIFGFIGRMHKRNNRYWLETDNFVTSTGKNTENYKGLSPTVFAYLKSPLGTTTSTSSQKIGFCKQATQMHTTQNPKSFVTYHEGFNTNTRNKNIFVVDEELPFTKSSMASPLVFDHLIKSYFPQLNDSNSFDAVRYDAHKKIQIEYFPITFLTHDQWINEYILSYL